MPDPQPMNKSQEYRAIAATLTAGLLANPSFNLAQNIGGVGSVTQLYMQVLNDLPRVLKL